MNFTYRIHAIERMFQRDITEQDVENVVHNGEIIQTYLNDKPYPSYLSLGFSEKRPIHVVYAIDDKENIIIIITVYEPALDKWQIGFKMRKQ